MYDPHDYYFKQAKKQWYAARSIFKLEEIDQKYKIFERGAKSVLDIGCAPGSWSQFAHKRLKEIGNNNFQLVGFDIKDMKINLSNASFYNQDITDVQKVDELITSHWITSFDIIISDMAPNTIWFRDIDAIRSINLLEKTLWIYEKYATANTKIAIKIFMWPGYDEFLQQMKAIVGAKWFKVFKPKAVRKESKEVYIVKY